ncbi:MAG: right-handed parallel beta-helix repeat-containing protein [Candidatus Bathyarchaeota archaeon]|nr:right-handed parallel beta-helix repeat-containing protein [Candidatus Bathyarchaeota archaeon]
MIESNSETPREAQARLLWSNLTSAQVNSSFPFSRRGSSNWIDEAEATFLGGAIFAMQTGKKAYLQKPDELCKWLNSTDKKNLFYRYHISSESWTTPSSTNYAASRLAELAVYANLSHQWKPLLQEVTSTFIRRYVSGTNRVYQSVGYDGSVANAAAGAHETSASVIALTLSAYTLGNDTIRDTAYQLIMNYPLGAVKLPYHQVNQDGSPRIAYCKEDESFGLYVLAMETYYYYFPELEIKNRIKEVVEAGYHYMWNSGEGRWNYRTDADTGATVWSIGVHGFGFTDEAFLQAYLIWKNETWLDRMKFDMETMILRGAIIYNGLIAHDTKGQDNANEHWNVAARRTLALLYSLNQTGFYKNSTYLTQANALFANATRAHERSKGWQIMVRPSDYSDCAPKNTQVQFSKWLQFVNNTDAALNTLADLYRYFGSPTLGNVQGPVPLTWVVDDDGQSDFQTIQEAVDYARIGDTVQVRNGHYYEKLLIQKPLVLVGEDPESTVIDADSIGEVVEVRASSVNISLFTIRKSGVGKPGVYLNGVERCNIVKNNILENDLGIYVDSSSSNKIAGNDITFCVKGLILNSSKYNIFHGNRIANSLEVGFSLENGSSYNRICHNNFVENEEQLNVSNSSDNAFDNSYPSGGNFWSDYGSIDMYCGAEQNEDGGDGIGDTPYLLGSEIKDRYPFMDYWYSAEVTVVNVTMSESPSLQVLTIGRGLTIKIDVAIVNRRSYRTACNLTVYAGATEVETSLLELKPREAMNLTVPMNTTEFEYGNYTMWISTRLSTDELEIIENTVNGGCVFLTILGDIDGSRTVDIYDMVLLCSYYGIDVNDPKYTYIYDFDNTAEIDIFDLVLAAINYGKTW